MCRWGPREDVAEIEYGTSDLPDDLHAMDASDALDAPEQPDSSEASEASEAFGSESAFSMWRYVSIRKWLAAEGQPNGQTAE